MSYGGEMVTLTRDVIGVLVPAGTRVELPVGATANITQALGGSYTIVVEGHMFRIDGKDADALGKTPTQVPELAEDASEDDISKAVWQQLASCYDPEIPINIVDLGLVYDVHLETAEGGGHRVEIKMTLTAPGCGMGEILVTDIREKVQQLPGVVKTDVELVFDPPWTQDMMSEAAMLQAGFI